jgi:hypothetical protein
MFDPVTANLEADQVLRALPGKPTKRASAAHSAEAIKETLGEEWLPRIYRERILSMRTRSHHLSIPSKTALIEVQHTLLGVELKIGRWRGLCPDLATAHYLSIFARVRCPDIAVPYDISQISRLVEDLEASWRRMLHLIGQVTEDRAPVFHSRLQRVLIDQISSEIHQAGAGTAVPQFNQNTKQRRTSRA